MWFLRREDEEEEEDGGRGSRRGSSQDDGVGLAVDDGASNRRTRSASVRRQGSGEEQDRGRIWDELELIKYIDNNANSINGGLTTLYHY